MARKRLFQRIQDQIAEEGLTARTNKSRKWLRQNIQNMKMNSGAKTAMVNASGKASKEFARFDRDKIFIGRMYFYIYDPKTKEKLPYYDTFPLVIPIAPYVDGFLGLNLHYVHPRHRISILDELESILTNTNYDDTTRARISYGYLKNTSRILEARPCIKRYLYSHVRSRFLEVSADEWDIAVMLPFEEFQKKPKTTVWARSKRTF